MRLRYRPPDHEEDARDIPEVLLAELVDVILETPAIIRNEDPALLLVRHISVHRLATASRAWLGEAISAATEHL